MHGYVRNPFQGLFHVRSHEPFRGPSHPAFRQGHGQAGLEFLYSTALAVLFLIMALAVFSQCQQEAYNLAASGAAKRACNAVAAQINGVAASGAGTEVLLIVPGAETGANYTMVVNGQNRLLSVGYAEGVSGCQLVTAAVSNGTPGTFMIREGATIRNVDGVVVVG